MLFRSRKERAFRFPRRLRKVGVILNAQGTAQRQIHPVLSGGTTNELSFTKASWNYSNCCNFCFKNQPLTFPVAPCRSNRFTAASRARLRFCATHTPHMVSVVAITSTATAAPGPTVVLWLESDMIRTFVRAGLGLCGKIESMPLRG